MALHVINQDHYMFVETDPGTYPLTKDNVGTRFAYVIVRTFADPNDPEDVAAAYRINAVEDNDGETRYAVTVRDVPVDAFWSMTVYNAEGYLEKNQLGVYSYNNLTATHSEDRSHTIHFGGCDDGRINCIPIMPNWSYTVRMYMPGEEITSGNWVVPHSTVG